MAHFDPMSTRAGYARSFSLCLPVAGRGFSLAPQRIHQRRRWQPQGDTLAVAAADAPEHRVGRVTPVQPDLLIVPNPARVRTSEHPNRPVTSPTVLRRTTACRSGRRAPGSGDRGLPCPPVVGCQEGHGCLGRAPGSREGAYASSAVPPVDGPSTRPVGARPPGGSCCRMRGSPPTRAADDGFRLSVSGAADTADPGPGTAMSRVSPRPATRDGGRWPDDPGPGSGPTVAAVP